MEKYYTEKEEKKVKAQYHWESRSEDKERKSKNQQVGEEKERQRGEEVQYTKDLESY